MSGFSDMGPSATSQYRKAQDLLKVFCIKHDRWIGFVSGTASAVP
jgi:hypothetical protein